MGAITWSPLPPVSLTKFCKPSFWNSALTRSALSDRSFQGIEIEDDAVGLF